MIVTEKQKTELNLLYHESLAQLKEAKYIKGKPLNVEETKIALQKALSNIINYLESK